MTGSIPGTDLSADPGAVDGVRPASTHAPLAPGCPVEHHRQPVQELCEGSRRHHSTARSLPPTVMINA